MLKITRGSAFVETMRRLQVGGRTPKPFPGKYPTRWLIEIQLLGTEKKLFEYFGKPNMTVSKTVADYLGGRVTTQVLHVTFMEFDRGGPISSYIGGWNPRSNATRVFYGMAAESLLFKFYYPWNPGELITPWERGIFSKRIRWREKVWFVYAGIKVLKMQEHLVRHKGWLDTIGIVYEAKKGATDAH